MLVSRKIGKISRGCVTLSLGEKRLFLLDMDGTLYLGERLFPGVREFLRAVKNCGGRYLFLTNNSSRGIQGYLEKLARLGIDAAEEDFLTSTDATIRCLQKEYPTARCYVAGTRSFYQQLQENGIDVTDMPDDKVTMVLSGYDTELTYEKLVSASRLLTDGADWIATNPDWVCPTEWGSVPDCGSICQMLTTATGREPRFIGKPRPEMVYLALEKTGFSPAQALMVGDRIYTDIAAGVNAGIDTAFVLSGEGTKADVEKFNVRPTWVFDDIMALWRRWEAER